MENNFLTDSELHQLFGNDKTFAKPDEAIQARLNNTFVVKRKINRIYQNSFYGLFAIIPGFLRLPVRPAIVTLLFMSMIFVMPENPLKNTGTTLDSLNHLKIVKTDSLKAFILSGDTCYFQGS